MRTFVVLCLIGLMSSLVAARRGSISNSLYDDDILDDGKRNLDDDNTDAESAKRRNPCVRKRCYRGETCILDDQLNPMCICKPDCRFHENQSDRYKACSTKNVTYSSECHLDRDHCLCKRNEHGCSSPGARKVQLEYFGPCMELPPCEKGQKEQFPYRLRNWLFVVMEEMARRAALGEYMELLDEAARDETHSYAVIWKFCDLDVDPQDRYVSRRELQTTVRTLKSLEACLVPFLDDCDEDDNRKITLAEWGRCLGVTDDKIIDKCHHITKHKKGRK